VYSTRPAPILPRLQEICETRRRLASGRAELLEFCIGYRSESDHRSQPLNRSGPPQIIESRRNRFITLVQQPEEPNVAVVRWHVRGLYCRDTLLEDSCAISIQCGIMHRP
jgi:hypothetical protein